MNKKILMQIGSFLVMFALEMIAAYVDPASVVFNVLMVLALLMIPVFVIAGRIPEVSGNQNRQISSESILAKAA